MAWAIGALVFLLLLQMGRRIENQQQELDALQPEDDDDLTPLP